MEKEDIIELLKQNLKIKIAKGMGSQYNDYEYEETLEISIYMVDEEFNHIDIDTASIPLRNLKS